VLDAQTMTLAPLVPDSRYALVPRAACVQAARRARQPVRRAVAGCSARWTTKRGPFTATAARVRVPVAGELKPQLRALLQYHCGAPMLRTRQMMMDLQSL
jgi:DNA repair protein RecO (recombination protein O)